MVESTSGFLTAGNLAMDGGGGEAPRAREWAFWGAGATWGSRSVPEAPCPNWARRAGDPGARCSVFAPAVRACAWPWFLPARSCSQAPSGE